MHALYFLFLSHFRFCLDSDLTPIWTQSELDFETAHSHSMTTAWIFISNQWHLVWATDNLCMHRNIMNTMRWFKQGKQSNGHLMILTHAYCLSLTCIHQPMPPLLTSEHKIASTYGKWNSGDIANSHSNPIKTWLQQKHTPTMHTCPSVSFWARIHSWSCEERIGMCDYTV